MIKILSFFFVCTLLGCSQNKANSTRDLVIANGQMPNLVKDIDRNIQLVYGCGDSLMSIVSYDEGSSFAPPSLIDILPHLAASHTRGPQIAATSHGLVLTVCNSMGDIFCYTKSPSLPWVKSGKVNDQDTIDKENLIALGADGELAFSAWLDVRNNGKNKIYGALSVDGGKTWSKNRMIYNSPDSSVCSCCKPSVVVHGKNVYVMFRNWLKGNRDMYLTQSKDGGDHFEPAKKLGVGSWKLNACPMDGGSLALKTNGEIHTVWRREGRVFSAIAGMPEKEIGEGKGCAIEMVNGQNVYAWTENGELKIIKPGGEKITVGRGMQPVIKAIGKEKLICVWEQEKQVHAAVISL
ncbi:MAG: exo-alpha-sialidase [Ferruginibacter sp.]|nr:exo-alpha-sialidase [Ferruginibacter sp.]